MTERKPLLDVFLSSAKKDLFHSVEQGSQMWREDPFDVESVHEKARAQFKRLLAQATTPPGIDSGRMLLLLGESGSGKTHLIRAFRNHVHVHGLGFVGYLQMTTSITSYSRYLVSNLVDSLGQTYYESMGTSSGLRRLSNAIAARCGDTETIRALCEDADLDVVKVVDLVERAADRLIAHPRYGDLDLDLVRALLFLQRQDTALEKRVVKYLRCEALGERDQRLLGGLSPKIGDEDAQRLVEQIGRLIWAFDNRSLVLCVDQFEDAYRSEDAEAQFRRAMSSLCAVADQVPSSIIVISCLGDYYRMVKPRLTRSTLDRLESNPPSTELSSQRSAKEVEQIIAQRLGYLYETSGIKPEDGPTDPLYPFPPHFVEQLVGLRVRDVLDQCQRFREACIEAGRLVDPNGLPPPVPSTAPTLEILTAKVAREKIEQAWNDFLSQFRDGSPDTEREIVQLFGWAVETCAEVLDSGHGFNVTVRGEALEIRVMVPTGDGAHRLGEEIFVALCNRGAQGNGLRTQLEGACHQAGQRIPAILRCTEFPKDRRTLVWKALESIIENGGRKAVLDQGDLRKMAAFRSFRAAHAQHPHFAEWLKEQRLLSQILPIIHILELDHLDRFEQTSTPRVPGPSAARFRPSTFDSLPVASRPPKTRSAPAEPIVPSELGTLLLGTTVGLIPQEVKLDAGALVAHAAFLGDNGTELAIDLVEQLLLRGIPVLLVDRKGALAACARKGLWEDHLPDPALEARRLALRGRINIALFAPGRAEGRPLGAPLVPRSIAALRDFDPDQAANHAAQALGDLLGYKHTLKGKKLRTVLAKAFSLFAQNNKLDELDLGSLLALVAEQDQALVTALGQRDLGHLEALARDLEELRQSTGHLFSSGSSGCEELDADLLLGVDLSARPDRTRLSIVDLSFLEGDEQHLFWVSQLVLSLTQRVARASSPHLSAVVLFDASELYLPAQGQAQPATKPLLLNLLRQAQTGGLGILLATKSPHHLDAQCLETLQSFFIGRVTDAAALEVVKRLLGDSRIDAAARIAAQGEGECHLIHHGRVQAFQGGRSVFRAAPVTEGEP